MKNKIKTHLNKVRDTGMNGLRGIAIAANICKNFSLTLFNGKHLLHTVKINNSHSQYVLGVLQ